MTTEREFDAVLRSWFDDSAPSGPPPSLLESVVAATAHIRPRPPWLVRLRGVPVPTGREGLQRFAPVALAAAVVILILVGVGLFVRSPNVGPPPPAPTASGGVTSPGPRSSDRNGAIAYVTQSGLSPLFLVLPDKAPLQLAPSSTGIGNPVTCPSFSPDGTMLASGMPGGSIYVLTIDQRGQIGDGSRLDGLVGETPHCAAWAPDSSAVAFLDGAALVILPLVGEPLRIEGWDTGDGDDPFAIDYPADHAVQWSPDGSVIAVARPSGTWLVPIDGTAPHRLQETPAFSVSWSPDGTRLVVGAGGPKALVIGTAGGSILAQLPAGYGAPVWSPVEDRIALMDADAGLVVVQPDGTNRLVIDDYGYHPTWSPDGRQLIYMQDAAPMAWRLLVAHAAAGPGEPTTIVDSIAMSSARSFPGAEQITWQPVGP